MLNCEEGFDLPDILLPVGEYLTDTVPDCDDIDDADQAFAWANSFSMAWWRAWELSDAGF